MRCLVLGLLLGICSCKTIRPIAAELSALANNCQEPVALQTYLKGRMSCTADGFYDPKPEEARKRDLPLWIPCNDVEWIDDTADLFGPGVGNDAATLELSTYSRINDWLGSADRFTPATVGQVFQNFDAPLPASENNPILDSAMARAIKDMIHNAQANIVMDIFLLGGSWGADILHDLGAAADRGVDVILLHDNVSKFSVANEMDPLWQAAQQFAQKHPKFVALDANIHPPARVSSLPFGFDNLTKAISELQVLKNLTAINVSIEGRSDHSKILIVDALFTKSIDEYLQMKPRALVSSHNLVDSAAAAYHDEAVIVRGPAAVVALLDYQSDIRWAWEQAKRTRKISADDERLLQSVSDRLEKLRTTPTLVKGQGWINVQPLQISANDEVRNLDAGIIPKIMAATESIDLYGRIAYNWPLAMALKEALARGVKVRIILDQQTTAGALGNAVLPYMLEKAPRRKANGQETLVLENGAGQIIRPNDLPIKWFLPFRPGRIFGSKDRSDLLQEIHAKTIIIDGRLALFGSANMDSLSWAGGFREYSVWIDDPALAGESARQFDRLWNHPLLTISHKVWMGEEAVPAEVSDYLKSRVQATACNATAESCQPDKILQGGRDYADSSLITKREILRKILAEEADRIKLLIPAKILLDEKGKPFCPER